MKANEIGNISRRQASATGLGVLAFLVLWSAAAPAQARASAKAACKDLPLRVTISGVADPWNGGMYGDERDLAGNLDPTRDSTYTDGVDGVTARILVCDGSKDVVLNLQNSQRSFTVDFSHNLVPADAGEFQPSGPVGGWFIKVFRAAISDGQLDTWMPVNVNLPSVVSLKKSCTSVAVWVRCAHAEKTSPQTDVAD